MDVRMNSHLRGVLLAVTVSFTHTAHAEITALELAETCARALAQNYVGLDAEACNWYVAPCPVCGPGAQPEAAWCAPAGEPVTTIAARAAAALRARPDAAHEGAKAAVKDILGRAYPCK
jgi:phage tail sheath gpL-like